MNPITVTISDACKASGISRATLYRAIGRRELDVVKIGARTLIKCEQLKNWLEGNTLKKNAA